MWLARYVRFPATYCCLRAGISFVCWPCGGSDLNQLPTALPDFPRAWETWSESTFYRSIKWVDLSGKSSNSTTPSTMSSHRVSTQLNGSVRSFVRRVSGLTDPMRQHLKCAAFRHWGNPQDVGRPET